MIESSNFQFKRANKEDILQVVNFRKGEVKIGERIHVSPPENKPFFLLLGIEESDGPIANNGLPGAEKAFNAFFKRFVNMQSNRFLDGQEIVFIGTVERKDKTGNSANTTISIEELDAVVGEVLHTFMTPKAIPVVIGGGHNNAFPIIRHLALSNQGPIDVINLDPHADCRTTEFRHSGNSFSFAKTANYLDHYTVLGLHQAYNNEYILSYLEDQEFHFTFFENYLANSVQFSTDIQSVFANISSTKPVGIELDLDAIQHMPSSAFTPSGFSVEQARSYVRLMATHKNCCYFHLPEGAPHSLEDEKMVGKTLAYLVWDFIQVHKQHFA